MFRDYVSSEDGNVADEYKNDTGFITHNVFDESVLVVNKELMKDLKIESYENLLQLQIQQTLQARLLK